MKLEVLKLPFGIRTNKYLPDNRLLDCLGEQGIRKLVNDHYNLLVESEIKDMFPPKGEGLEAAKRRAADFFIQRLGGPDYYSQTRGKPMLSRRHAPFKISPNGRVIWLECYKQLLSEVDVPEEIVLSFWNWLNELSNWMVNTLETYNGIHFNSEK